MSHRGSSIVRQQTVVIVGIFKEVEAQTPGVPQAEVKTGLEALSGGFDVSMCQHSFIVAEEALDGPGYLIQ